MLSSKVLRGGVSLILQDTINFILRWKRATNESILKHSYAKKEGNGNVSEELPVCPGWADTGNNQDRTLQGPPLSNALCPMGTRKL